MKEYLVLQNKKKTETTLVPSELLTADDKVDMEGDPKTVVHKIYAHCDEDAYEKWESWLDQSRIWDD